MIINLLTAISSKTSGNPESDYTDTCADLFHLQVRTHYFKKIQQKKNIVYKLHRRTDAMEASGFLQSLTP